MSIVVTLLLMWQVDLESAALLRSTGAGLFDHYRADDMSSSTFAVNREKTLRKHAKDRMERSSLTDISLIRDGLGGFVPRAASG